MIERNAFAAGMAVLAGNFSRTLDAALIRVYYDALSPKLDTDGFNLAVSRAIAAETFWPPVARLLELAGAQTDPADESLDAVRSLLRTHGGPQYLPGATWQALPEETKRAVIACGGLWKINGMDGDAEARLRKKFRDAFHAPAPKAIEAPHPDSRIERLVSETATALTR